MVNTVGADALISCLFAKYHYLFWRPVTAIDPTAITADGFGPVPGYDDGNPATLEQMGWRPLLATPNHPEYPAAHGAVTSAMAEVYALNDSIDDGLWLKNTLEELKPLVNTSSLVRANEPIKIYEDN